MLALAAHRLGVSVRCATDREDSCARDVCAVDALDLRDADALRVWARGLDAVTYEFENVPVRAAEVVGEVTLVRPGPAALRAAQDRVLEKALFGQLGIPTPAWAAIDGEGDLGRALATTGLPAVLKTRREGYDGKGQAVARTAEEARHAAAALLATAPAGLIAEALVPFVAERSILAVRAADGRIGHYPLVTNRHEGGILRMSEVDPGRAPASEPAARRAADALLAELGYVGVLAVEFFELADGSLLANEFAPRVHNSGHWTIEGAATSQFENHVRAVLGLALGSCAAVGRARMENLIGDAPPLPELLADPSARVHLYGKSPRAGRKLGHVTWVHAGG